MNVLQAWVQYRFIALVPGYFTAKYIQINKSPNVNNHTFFEFEIFTKFWCTTKRTQVSCVRFVSLTLNYVFKSFICVLTIQIVLFNYFNNKCANVLMHCLWLFFYKYLTVQGIYLKKFNVGYSKFFAMLLPSYTARIGKENISFVKYWR